MSDLACLLRQVVFVIGNKLWLVLRPKDGLFAQDLVLQLNFIILVLLPLAEKALLHGQTFLVFFLLRSTIDYGDRRGLDLSFDLVDAFFLEIATNLLVVARDWPFVASW